MDHFTVLFIVACTWTQGVVGGMQDCWDPEKLARMNFKQTPAEANDPGLNQFSKMVKCLEMQGGGGANRQLQTDWNIWSNMGQKTRNNHYNNRKNFGSRGGTTSQWDNNPYNTQQSDRNDNGDNWGSRQRPGQGGLQGAIGRGHNLRPGPMGTGNQPKPGVHPDDWGRVNTNLRGAEEDVGWTSRHGSGDDPPPGWSKERAREERRKLKRDQRKKQIELGKRRRVQEEQHGIVSGGNGDNMGSIGGGELYPPSVPELTGEGDGGGDGGHVFQPSVEMDNDDLRGGDGGGREMQGELTAVSLERKYSYAIMALSVVVLAVLMVATIFCCNSSNSTMAQAANARAALATQNAATAGGALPSGGGCNAGVIGGAQFDNYSIYSYKGGGGTMGTYGPAAHATGSGGMDTLGGASLRTETLKSTRSMASRASPQYRVSDIDPDFARRFDRDNHHY